ncbi:glyoxalase [Nocardioides gansuensis]|uniref:Glyoxalase n=1 Tax=Nocardioides gansuensis TaxID=2138300 RepID=A0A2T8F9G5_9ACTN|nr:VOC family protein [Nocardioides gansuensis]PVG82374.1 glyoxalase [Nocardioides gansuensis]
MSTARTYPEGVTSWIELEHRDLAGAQAFYSGLFGWTFDDVTSPGQQSRHLVARLDGQDVAGLAGPTTPGEVGDPGWQTFVAVDDVGRALARVEAAGGRTVRGPDEAGQHGWTAACTDSSGVPFRLRQAGLRAGAQLTNAPGAWNFSDLHTDDPEGSAAFYADVFGWAFADLGFATMIRRPGYGDHLAATSDPDIHARQSGVSVPAGFADAIGWLVRAEPGEQPHWHVTFTVADRDDAVDAVVRLGGAVLRRTDSDWTREALVRDPQGAVFSVSQFTPPGGDG